MSVSPIDMRPYQAFVSYSHADGQAVGDVVRWLEDVAGFRIWSDKRRLAASATLATELPEAISQSRSMILVVSKDSTASGWVKEEYGAAIHQRTRFKKYRIVPLRLDDGPIPEFLATTTWIDLVDGRLDLDSANQLLTALYYDEIGPAPGEWPDIFVSRTWRDEEATAADAICRLLVQRGFRLVGDAPDQEGFSDEKDRVRSIIGSCGAMVAIAPHRGEGTTSKYIVAEIEMARSLGLPYLIIRDENVELPGDLIDSAVGSRAFSLNSVASEAGADLDGLMLINEEYRTPGRPHYVFFATDFPDAGSERNAYVRQLIERVTAMPCVLGDDIREGQIQEVIAQRLARAFCVLADITEDNLNTCIEAGIARGAGTRLHLIAKGSRRRPPFMFRDHQVWFYEDDVELLGLVHRIVYPYRRRVLNREFAAM